jgi:PKD repeat protein
MKLFFTFFLFSITFLSAYNTEITQSDNSEIITKFQVNMEVKQMKNLDNKIYLNLHDTLDNKNYIVVTDTNFNIVSEEVYDDEQIWLSDDMLTVAGANVINAKDFVYEYSIYDLNSQEVLFSGETNDRMLNIANSLFEGYSFTPSKLQYLKQLDTLLADSYIDYANGSYILKQNNNYHYFNSINSIFYSLNYYNQYEYYNEQTHEWVTVEMSDYSSRLLFESGEELVFDDSFPNNQKFNYIQSSNDEKFVAGVYFENREIGNLGDRNELYLYKMDDFGLYDKIELKENYRNCSFSYNNQFLFIFYENAITYVDAIEVYDLKSKSIINSIYNKSPIFPESFSSLLNVKDNIYSFENNIIYKFNLNREFLEFKARFTADKQKVFLNDEINFTDLSAGEVHEIEWNFGDGSTSNEKNPVHSYNEIGAYDITLTITSKDTQDIILLEDYIQVFDERKFFIEKSKSEGLVPFESSLKCYTYNDYINYEWFVNNKEYKSINGPTIKFELLGNHDITVVAYDYFGSDTLIDKNAINAKLPYIGFDDYEEYFPHYNKKIIGVNAIKSKQGGYILQVNNSANSDSTEIVRLNENFEIIWKKEYVNSFQAGYILEQLPDENYIVVSDSSSKYNNYEIDILDDFGDVENRIVFNEGTLRYARSFNIQDILVDDNRVLSLIVDFDVVDKQGYEKLKISELKDNEFVTIKEITRPFPDDDNRYFLLKENNYYYLIHKIFKNTPEKTINTLITKYDFAFNEIETDTLSEISFDKVQMLDGNLYGLKKHQSYDILIKQNGDKHEIFQPTARIDDFVRIDNYLFIPHYDDKIFSGLYILNHILGLFNDNIFFLSRFAELYDIKYEDGNLFFFGKIQNAQGEQLYILKSALDNFITDTNVENPETEGFIQIYPNPAEDYIEITIVSQNVNKVLQPLVQDGEFEIYDVLGERVMSESIHPMTRSHRMNVGNLPKGVYFIRIGNKIEKFIKK